MQRLQSRRVFGRFENVKEARVAAVSEERGEREERRPGREDRSECRAVQVPQDLCCSVLEYQLNPRLRFLIGMVHSQFILIA